MFDAARLYNGVVVVGIFLQRANYRGQAGLILAIVSGMLGVIFALNLAAKRR